ncbi:cation diffusion facilitator family transporter [Candidatus Nitrosocosmicus agrestis]|uniref:cation diffusion facilitator family transporter n=1 Tax=Candidatus Nitrosocosmicus agrestis TaxID=2563600 RepID=UPI001331AFDD|nr:cation diffusion facilitator family transporter [Candidatus Nitrosocosmicus sp. SS]
MHSNTIEIIKTNTKIKKLRIVLILISTYLVIEVIAGFYTGSLALLADAGHMFTDTFGIGIALIAAIYSKKEATPIHTFGFFRTEILASLVNSIILSLLSIIIIYEAYRRFFEPTEIQSLPMIVVAVVGLLINIAGMYFLRGEHIHNHGTKNDEHTKHLFSSSTVEHSDISMDPHPDKIKNNDEIEDLNMKGARLELLSDTIGSVGVIVGGIIIAATNLKIIDPILSIGLAIFILPRLWSLLKKSVHILMEGVPSNISYEMIQQSLLQTKGVTGVFDLHIWSISSGIHALSAHIVVMDTSSSYQVLHDINSVLENRFKITHSTIQIEKFHPTNSD